MVDKTNIEAPNVSRDSMEKPFNKFRIANNFLLKSLFYETTGADKSSVVYTLKDVDHEGFPSLYRLYMETMDPTEWNFANKYLESWTHWERLKECSWFKPIHERWIRELDLKIKSKALFRIMHEATTNSKESFQANKYLLEKGWEPKTTSGRGRPSKEEVNRAAKGIAEEHRRLEQDLLRISTINVSRDSISAVA